MLNEHQLQTLNDVFWREIAGISWPQIGLVLLFALLVFIPGIIRIKKKKSTFKDVFLVYWLVVWSGIMLCITILRREPGYASGKINPFPTWENFGGNGLKTVFSIYNVLLFVPYGFLIRLQRHRSENRKAFIFTLVAGLITTWGIEIIQLVTSMGNFEFTDIINNFIGALIGAIMGGAFLKIYRKCRFGLHPERNILK